LRVEPGRKTIIARAGIRGNPASPRVARTVEAGKTPATVARRISVLRDTYKQLVAKGLVS